MCRLDNYNSLLYGLPKFLICRLQLVQNCAICGSKYDCITPLLRELHWLPLKQRVVFLLLTFKPLNDLGPSYIHDLLQTYEPYRNLQSSTRNFLVTPKVKIFMVIMLFSVCTPKLWNNLPEHIKCSLNLTSFKKDLSF